MDRKEPKDGQLTNLFHIHLIFREVAKYLALPDLISCSGVNREWCVIFRKQIWGSHPCNIHLRWMDRPCEQLKNLDILLRTSTFDLPFNGILAVDFRAFPLSDKYSCPGESHEDIMLSGCYETLLRKVHFTSFEMILPSRESKLGGYEDHSCPAVRCMKNIMKLNAGLLKSLRIGHCPKVASLLDYFEVDLSLRPGWLGNLERLDLGSRYYFVKSIHTAEILEVSPNLKSIIGKFPRSHIGGDGYGASSHSQSNSSNGVIPENKYKCIKEAKGLTASQLLSVAKEKPELEYLSLFSPWKGDTFPPFGFSEGRDEQGIAIKALNILFPSSWSSLRVIMGKIFQIGVLSREVDKGNWPLPSVSRLELSSTYQELSYLTYMNLPLMFPNLSQVSIWPWKYTPDLDPNLLRHESDFDSADSTVQNLSLYDYIAEEYLKILESAFPNVTDFSYHQCEEVKEMCGALWKMNWGKMTSLKFCSVPINLDVEDAFFGFPPEEREFMGSQVGLGGGSTVHHVPSKFSAFNFQNLKRIQLELEECKSRRDVFSKPQSAPFPGNEIQRVPLISQITAQKISQCWTGLEMEILMEPGYIPVNGTLVTGDTYSTLLKCPGLHLTTCPCDHKRHRKDICQVKKWKFTVSFK